MGDEVRLRATGAERGTGDSVNFLFAGTVSGETFAGPLYMGEYLNAKFTARRHSYPVSRGTILVPGGPPLAN